jgi:hypothetical protein
VTKMVDMAYSSGSCGGSCSRVVARAVTITPGSAALRTETLEATNEAALDRSDASLVEMYEADFEDGRPLSRAGRPRNGRASNARVGGVAGSSRCPKRPGGAS